MEEESTFGEQNEGKSFKELSNVSRDEYAVDVKNSVVVQIFKFCFYIDTHKDTKLQNYIGWDEEKPFNERRSYRYVFFLKTPMVPKPDQRQKSYFQDAFDQNSNQNWLVGQKWFSTSQVSDALRRKSSNSIEEFLGISNLQNSITVTTNSHQTTVSEETEPYVSTFSAPEWLESIASQINILRNSSNHTERDHEDLVRQLFEKLGYRPQEEIRFQRGRIDILITANNRPVNTIEVKKSWSLSSQNINHVRQAFNYSNEIGTRYVTITNGDRYIFYDREKGLSYQEMLVGEFDITNLKQEDLEILNSFHIKNFSGY